MANPIRNTLIHFSLIITLWIASAQPTPVVASECTHYASPAGTGSGTSPSTPFKIADFWARARAGYTLCLLDGKYTGATSMINPPSGLSGTRNLPITIRALNDGKVTLDGLGLHEPVRLNNNDFFVLEGFNAHSSSRNVVTIFRSSNNIIRRVAAWDAADLNTNIFGIHRGDHNLLEDVAGWGIARKIFSFSQGGNYTTVRRAWGRWEGSHVAGPKMTYTLAYNNYDTVCENCIGTWSGERIKATYTLMDYYGKPASGRRSGIYSDYRVDQPYGIFAIDSMTNDKNARAKLLGSIAYLRASDRFAASQAIFVTKVDSFEIVDTVVYIEPGTHPSKKGFSLNNLQGGGGSSLIAKSITAIGGKNSNYGSNWKMSQIAEGKSLDSVPDVFTSSSGAKICHRYINGVLTHDPLWPWPMNQRIISAMIESGRAPVNVTQTIEEMFGRIPAQCKNAG